MHALTWLLLLSPQFCLVLLPLGLWFLPPGAWDLGLLLGFHALGQLGVSLGYHRWLTHKSFKPVKPLGWVLLAFGAFAGVGPALWWVAVDRAHHKHCQKEGDPHCPIHPEAGLPQPWMARFGFGFTRLARSIPWKDLPEAKSPALAWIQAAYFPTTLLVFLAPGALTFFVYQDPRAALRASFWASGVRIALGQWAFAMLRDHSHRIGPPTFPGRHKARNLPALSLWSFGEAYHGNHHAFPRSARLGFGWSQPDLGWGFLRVLSWVGLARDLKDDGTKAQEKLAKLREKSKAKEAAKTKARAKGKKKRGPSTRRQTQPARKNRSPKS